MPCNRPFLCACLLFAGLTARAAPRLAVVEPLAPPTMVGLAAQVALEVEQAARGQRIPLMPAAEVQAALGPQRYRTLQACGAAPACVAEIARALRVDRVVTGALGRDERSYLLQLSLLDVTKERLISDADLSVLIVTRRFMRDVRAAIPPLLRGQQGPRGTLVVSTSAPGARVFVDGRSAGESPATVTLRPGKHELRVELDGHLPVSRLVTVVADQTATEAVRLIRNPGVPGLPPETEVARAASSGGGWRVPTSAWVALGVAAAAAATATTLGIVAGNLERRVQDSLDPQTGVYGATRANVQQGHAEVLAANVLFGVSGAAVLTAVGLAIFTPQHAPVRLAGGPTPAGAALEVEF